MRKEDKEIQKRKLTKKMKQRDKERKKVQLMLSV